MNIQVSIAVIGAVAAITASFFTANATSNANVADISREVSIVQEREANHYGEVQKRLDTIDGKLDQLIKYNR